MNSRCPIIVTNLTTGEKTVFRSFRRALSEFGLSPNRMYHLLHDGSPVAVTASDGTPKTVSFAYKDQKYKAEPVMIDEGEKYSSLRYRRRLCISDNERN